MSAARYATFQDAISSPRDIEIRAFRTLTGMLTAAGDDSSARAMALHKVHKLWSILLSDLTDARNGLPADLKGKLISLGLWAQRESNARLADTTSLQPLINLHRDLAEGLEAQKRVMPSVPTRALSA